MNPAPARTLAIVSAILIAALVVSGIDPYDFATWLLEVFPVLVALPLMWFTLRRFPLTTLLYIGICLHSLVLILGGTYTYARVPLGFQLAEWFDLSRNPYDKIGHFFQGFVPALVAREILIRGRYVNGRGMLAFIVVSIVMFISSFYELIEWWVALAIGQGATEFLGTQGYEWDTQSDMFLALIGAVCALLTLARWHDRQIAQLPSGPKSA
ncbi:MAG TPA: DUF2238 domain-containing protein [Candidatus Kapabacteria bacterium]|nr:DUF2238 domain-containing protein [Candidatus Kapabacteria bacterium]